MAGASDAASLAEAHQAGQEALTTLLPGMLRQAWSLVDVHDLKGSMPRFMAAVKAIVFRYGQASAAGALEYYARERTAQGAPGRVPLRMPAPVPDQVIEAAVREAVNELYGPPSAESQAAAVAKLEKSVQSLVYNQGRKTIIDNASQDKEARGWYRVTNPGACSFCILLAIRGPVYKSEETGDFRAHHVQPNGTGGECMCHAAPWFGGSYSPTPRIAKYLKAYDALAADGLRGKEIRKAFRAHVENRAYIPSAEAKKKAEKAAARKKRLEQRRNKRTDS